MITDCFNMVRERDTGGRLHGKELLDRCSSPNIIWLIKSRRLRWAEHVVRIVESRGAYRDLVGKPEGKRPLGRRRHKMILKWIFKYWDGVGVGWIYLDRDVDTWRTVVNTLMNFWV